jgi:hypothetical protein
VLLLGDLDGEVRVNSVQRYMQRRVHECGFIQLSFYDLVELEVDVYYRLYYSIVATILKVINIDIDIPCGDGKNYFFYSVDILGCVAFGGRGD